MGDGGPSGSAARTIGTEERPRADRNRAVTALRDLRAVAYLEGVSFLLLLFVAMPLKYFAGMPEAVRAVGTAHGVLFLLYVAAACRAGLLRRWPARRWAENLAASLLPFGPFLADARLRRERDELHARSPRRPSEGTAHRAGRSVRRSPAAGEPDRPPTPSRRGASRGTARPRRCRFSRSGDAGLSPRGE